MQHKWTKDPQGAGVYRGELRQAPAARDTLMDFPAEWLMAWGQSRQYYGSILVQTKLIIVDKNKQNRLELNPLTKIHGNKWTQTRIKGKQLDLTETLLSG